MALHFGVPIPALRTYVGKAIKTGNRRLQAVVDPEGHTVLSTPTQRGGDFQYNHISVCNVISAWLRKASLPHLGGSSDRTCRGIFRAACPYVDEEMLQSINGIIPDFLFQFAHIPEDDHSLAGRNTLGDTKTLNASRQHYQTSTTDFGFAVKKIQSEVKSGYAAHAEKLDV